MKGKNLALSLASLLALFALAAPLTAQDAPREAQPQPSTPAVKLNLIVTDDKGRSVADVKREELRLFDEGVEQTITYFSKDELPVSYGLVVDNSGSLRTQMGGVIAAGHTIVGSNRPGDETFVLRFVDSKQINMMQDFTSEASLLRRALDEMFVQGGQTALVDAVYLATEHLLAKSKPAGDSGRRRAIVLISDGEDRASHFKLDALLSLLKTSDVQVFCIGLVGALDNEGGFITPSKRDKATSLLKRLAQETGGLAFNVKNAAELRQAVEEITGHLHTQYVVGYSPTHGDGKKDFRKVEVKLSEAAKGSKRKLVTRPGYSSAPRPATPDAVKKD